MTTVLLSHSPLDLIAISAYEAQHDYEEDESDDSMAGITPGQTGENSNDPRASASISTDGPAVVPSFDGEEEAHGEENDDHSDLLLSEDDLMMGTKDSSTRDSPNPEVVRGSAVQSTETVPSLKDEVDDEDERTMCEEEFQLPNKNPIAGGIDEAMDGILAEDEEEEDNAEDAEQTQQQSMSFGGLSNLGNTCYMASALQMLASLDSFVGSIRDEPLPTEKDDRVRDAFLDLIQRINKGETVEPEDFKSVIDERSPLFVGYQQQDAHEFITALLDFLDEDYQMKKQNQDDNQESEQKDDSADSVNEMDISTSSSRKRARSEDYSDEEEQGTKMDLAVPKSPFFGSSPAFSKLGIHDIDRLLHGSSSGNRCVSEFSAIPSSPINSPPRCKLVGGRMNTADINVTSYEYAKVNAHDSPITPSSRSENSDSPPAMCRNSSAESAEATKTPVDRFFTTTCRVRLTCDSCKYTRCHEEIYQHLSLEIGPDCGSVDDGLRRFFAPEHRELKCEKCFSESATQTVEIIGLPKVLLLHFKRFIVDVSPDYSSISYRKNQSVVAFDGELEFSEDSGGVLTEFLARDCSRPSCTSQQQTYALRSVVNHIGSSANCGHYTAVAHKQYPHGGREWTRFNDSFVTKISPTEAIDAAAQRTAYMVVYEIV